MEHQRCLLLAPPCPVRRHRNPMKHPSWRRVGTDKQRSLGNALPIDIARSSHLDPASAASARPPRSDLQARCIGSRRQPRWAPAQSRTSEPRQTAPAQSAPHPSSCRNRRRPLRLRSAAARRTGHPCRNACRSRCWRSRRGPSASRAAAGSTPWPRSTQQRRPRRPQAVRPRRSAARRGGPAAAPSSLQPTFRRTAKPLNVRGEPCCIRSARRRRWEPVLSVRLQWQRQAQRATLVTISSVSEPPSRGVARMREELEARRT
mmetsp:Transcript_26724/g.88810  ORF Transcript_26724/g.88810 Transcript_26724/m.88810 type:complete len:261 (+) Transcript_26724:1022-1804(+)